jgi:S-ribosylhomocysteine lyase LuxS involved in autoinducer biosynthesis
LGNFPNIYQQNASGGVVYVQDRLRYRKSMVMNAGLRFDFFDPGEEAVRVAAERALAAVRDHEGAIPGCSPERCGNWRDHSLPGAKAWAGEVLGRGLIVQETVLLADTPTV